MTMPWLRATSTSSGISSQVRMIVPVLRAPECENITGATEAFKGSAHRIR